MTYLEELEKILFVLKRKRTAWDRKDAVAFQDGEEVVGVYGDGEVDTQEEAVCLGSWFFITMNSATQTKF